MILTTKRFKPSDIIFIDVEKTNPKGCFKKVRILENTPYYFILDPRKDYPENCRRGIVFFKFTEDESNGEEPPKEFKAPFPRTAGNAQRQKYSRMFDAITSNGVIVNKETGAPLEKVIAEDVGGLAFLIENATSPGQLEEIREEIENHERSSALNFIDGSRLKKIYREKSVKLSKRNKTRARGR